jgi:WD40 repeat protein
MPAARRRTVIPVASDGSADDAVNDVPCGRLIATAASDQTARIWDAATGACLATLGGHDYDLREFDSHAGRPAVAPVDAALVVVAPS